ncbi:hypothetical protein FEF65_11155 [Mariprofundus erugo]|uniref:Uncharacterized protein n=1 Tax=Mariprofundus erugo TaxID=2528639 RepID=A0A5R9GNX7_9PROT|nr:hypothetical protein [Mariprofundus erugo]TLS66143.1 hypothetical protein FEF65_11155 [Mariprofundus erugo]
MELDTNNLFNGVIGNLIAAAILAVLTKVWFHRRKLALPFGTVAIAFFIVWGVVSGVQFAVDRLNSSEELSELQLQIDEYTQKKFPNEFQYGWRITVESIKPEALLALYWPQSEAVHPGPHPFDNPFVIEEVEKILKGKGIPGPFRWGLLLHTISRDEYLKLGGQGD